MPMKPPPESKPAVDMKSLPDGTHLTIVSERVVKTPRSRYHTERTIAVASDGTNYWVPPHVVKQADGTLVGSYIVEHIVANGKDTIALRNA